MTAPSGVVLGLVALAILALVVQRQMLLRDDCVTSKPDSLERTGAADAPMFESIPVAAHPAGSTSLLPVPALSAITRSVSDVEYKHWLSSFKAADPAYQDDCLRALQGESSPAAASQFAQDMFLWRNLFLHMTVIENKRGFYVDSGANEWKLYSNTLFFDKCLGWEGLCVEPVPEYHAGLAAHRSCTLIKECISDSTSSLTLHVNGAASFVGEHDNHPVGGNNQGVKVGCRPLDAMLKSVNRTHVDLWSLDVEGFEMSILEGGVLKRAQIDTLLIEDFWLSNRELDVLMSEHGYNKLHQLAIDSLYGLRSFNGGGQLAQWWYPPNWKDSWQSNRKFREKMRAEKRLAADL